MVTTAFEARVISIIVICVLLILLILGDVLNVDRMANQWRAYVARREKITNDNAITTTLSQNRCNSENENSNTCNKLDSSANDRKLAHGNEQKKQSPKIQEWSEEEEQHKFLSNVKHNQYPINSIIIHRNGSSRIEN